VDRHRKKRKTTFEWSDGDVRIHLEQEAIHIKANDKFGDPVELTKETALELSESLKELAAQIVD
jgi:hypothetical protein